METKASPFNSYFKLYSADGLQISFALNSDTLDDHLLNLDELRAKLTDKGYRLQPEEVASGERVEEITGWVLGETKEGKPCVHLYKSPLKFKITTLWEEMLPQVPITITPGIKAVIQAPELEQAVQRGWLQPCDFRIILKQRTGTDGTPILSDKGKPTWRFDRMFGAAPKETSGNGSSGSGQGVAKESYLSQADPHYKIYSSVGDGAKKFIEWGRKTQAAALETQHELAGVEMISDLTDYLDGSLEREGAGNFVLQVLSGDPDAAYTESFIQKLDGLVSLMVQDDEGNFVSNTHFKEKYLESLKQIMMVGMNKAKAKARA